MDHYTKLAIVALRSLGLMILLYTVPIILLGMMGRLLGETAASEGRKVSASLIGWLTYASTGVLLITLARPLARFASRGLDIEGSV